MVGLDAETAWAFVFWKPINTIICIYEKLSILSESVTSTVNFARSLAGRRCSCPSCQVVCMGIRVVNHGNVQGAALFSFYSPYGDGHCGSHREGDWSAAVSQVRSCLHEVLREGPNAKLLTRLVSPSRDALDAASVLYNRVDEGVHRLVMLSNRRIQELELVMEFEKVEECFKEVRPVCWFQWLPAATLWLCVPQQVLGLLISCVKV